MRQFLAALFLLVLVPYSLTAEVLRAAEVNGVSISVEDVSRERKLHLHEFEQELDLRATSQAIIERLVEYELLFQQAVKLKLFSEQVTGASSIGSLQGEDLSSDIEVRAKALNISQEEYLQRLKKDLAIERLIHTEVYSRVSVSDADVEEEFSANADRFRSAEELRLKELFFPFSSQSSRSLSVRQAEEIRAEIQENGTRFVEFMKKPVQDFQAYSGKDLGYVTKNQLPRDFAEKLFSLQIGSVSELFEEDKGVHIYYVVEKRGGVLPTFEEMAGSLREEILFRRRMQALRDYINTLRKASKVIIYQQ